MSVVALVEIVMTSIVALLPTSNLGVPWYHGFGWRYVNYTILVVPGALLLLWVYWHVSVKNWFTGPKHTIDSAPEAGRPRPWLALRPRTRSLDGS